jgi:predicted NACHT family NTPase
MSLPIQKSAAKNFAAADSEIGSHLCRCRQPKIVSLPIQKSAPKNFSATDLEIGSKTASLPI